MAKVLGVLALALVAWGSKLVPGAESYRKTAATAHDHLTDAKYPHPTRPIMQNRLSRSLRRKPKMSAISNFGHRDSVPI